MTRGAIYDMIQDFQAHCPVNMFAHPDSLFDFVYAQDVVSALMLASTDPWDGVTANISSGRGTRLLDLYHSFVTLFGFEVPLHVTEGEATVDILLNERARELGWRPTFSLEKGLAETLSYFLEKPLCR